MQAKIEFIEQIIDRMQKAAAANLATPGRSGGTVTITSAMADEIMITGDLHGHRKNFNGLRRVADLAKHPRRHLIMQEVCHGGEEYPAGGCMSHAMLEDVAKLKVDFPERFHFLLSNHELSELTDYPIKKGPTLLNLKFRVGLEFMYGPARERVVESYRAFIRTCPLAIRLPGGGFACHTMPQAHLRKFEMGIFSRELTTTDMSPGGAAFDICWGRDYSEPNAKAFAAQVGATVLLTGHEPVDTGYSTPNSMQVIFDCCHATPAYAILPTNQPLDQAKVVSLIQKI